MRPESLAERVCLTVRVCDGENLSTFRCLQSKLVPGLRRKPRPFPQNSSTNQEPGASNEESSESACGRGSCCLYGPPVTAVFVLASLFRDLIVHLRGSVLIWKHVQWVTNLRKICNRWSPHWGVAVLCVRAFCFSPSGKGTIKSCSGRIFLSCNF